MEFDEAAELITAATNTMDVSARRVVDVFAYLGDASASGPAEIGIAMQKASASAVEFGLSFEWLGAYIATVSEQTRQAPEVIGTALNSIMARLHSIKAKGYSEEDETKINDVAKALKHIDVALLDNEGNWRDMSAIFSDIAVQWETLDAKTQSYIATTLAGTRQQNFFLALMNDMAKGVEGGSRAYELYAGAMNAAGTAAQKYAVWQESVTAAQNRLTAATQSFYALLDADWMKGFYDGMAGLVEIITAGTDALGGWNLLMPVIVVGVTGLIAVVYKAVVAFKALKAAMVAGSAISTMMSGGMIGAILAVVGAVASVVTMLVGAAAMANEVEKTDYSNTINSVSNYKDTISSLVSELETLAGKTELTSAEQQRADEIMRTLSGTSLSMKTALENGGKGFDTLGEKAAAAREEVEKTERALRALNAADALQNLRDADKAYADAIKDAQEQYATSAQYGQYWDAYSAYMQEHPNGLYDQTYYGAKGTSAKKQENFYTYAYEKSRQENPIWDPKETRAAVDAEKKYWAGVLAELKKLGMDASSTVDEVNNMMLEFDIAGATYEQASLENLASAWQPVLDDLYTVMTDGTQFSQLPSFMQTAAKAYYESYVTGIGQQAQLAEGDLMAMAADLTGHVNKMTRFVEDNADFGALVNQFDDLLDAPRTQETVDQLNALLPLINEYITSYNSLTPSTDDDIALIPAFTLETLQAVAATAEEAGVAIASMSTADIYKDLALAKEEANGFATILSQLGTGDGQMINLHDAVMQTARDIAALTGITDESEIVKIGEKLLESLYETYPGIADYVDTVTGMLKDGWAEGIKDATNPWAELFEAARLEDALNAAKKDMAALDGSALWTELLSPDGKGLYTYAEDWARTLLPDGTSEEIQVQAQAFVEAFFEMFDEIDTTIIDADGRIAAGMDGIVATMRQAVHDAQTETSKLTSAYQTLHADRIARNEAISGLTAMKGYAVSGDTASMTSAFEALSTDAINAITSAMPSLIDKLHDGTATAQDFEAAILAINAAANEVGEEAWKEYFDDTESGL